jgi:hypothetical protein
VGKRRGNLRRTAIVEQGHWMGYEVVWVTPRRIEPPHSVQDAAKVESIATSMRREGWQGRPLLLTFYGSQPDQEEPWEDDLFALTGTHRLAAAVEIELEVVPCLIIVGNKLLYAYMRKMGLDPDDWQQWPKWDNGGYQLWQDQDELPDLFRRSKQWAGYHLMQAEIEINFY